LILFAAAVGQSRVNLVWQRFWLLVVTSFFIKNGIKILWYFLSIFCAASESTARKKHFEIYKPN
jgi:hypothetical protein